MQIPGDQRSFDKHAPVSEFTARERYHQLWFDNECPEARWTTSRLARLSQVATGSAEVEQSSCTALPSDWKLSHLKAYDILNVENHVGGDKKSVVC